MSLTVTKAAEESGIPRETIIFAIKRGWLKAHKTGIHTAPWQIDRSDFADWLSRRKEQAQLEAQRWESK